MPVFSHVALIPAITLSLITAERFESKNGGSWKYVLKDQGGNEITFRGVYHEVAAPERIIDTVELEGLPEKGHVILRTNRFEALPGSRTKLIMQIVCQSVSDRDAMLQPDMSRILMNHMGGLMSYWKRCKNSL